MKYVIKKLITMMGTLFVISILTFGVFQILPGNPVDVILGVDADPLQAQQLAKQLGLNLPLGQRYLVWVGGLLRGDLGISIRYQVPVVDLLRTSIPVSLSLTLYTLFITLLVVFPAGIYLAKHNNHKSGIFVSLLMQIGVAVPSFWVGILLIMLFAVTLRWLPSGDYVPFSQDIVGSIRSMILPAAAIAIGTSSVVIRYLKNTLLDQMNLDYVRTARSKGATQKQVLYGHVLRNALLPTITILGMILVDVLGGSIIVENVYNLPGIGHLIISGVGNRDFPLVEGLVFYLAMVVTGINLVVDLLYAAADPRIRLE